jgi:CheY-like chemotaxis protein
VSASELEWAISIIDRQATHMTRLVDDLLDVSRITRGRIELRMERVDVTSVLNSAVEASRTLMEKSGHHLTVDLPQEALFVDGDAARLTQVVANLLDNSAKYTDPGGHIGLSARREGADIAIRVTDDGIGIAPEVLPRVFDMFTQASLPLERSKGGLGVGLALVDRLVKLHGGTVTVRSEGPGTGSEFTIKLRAAPQFQLSGREPARDERPNDAATCRVLVVDDNQDSADSLALLLRLSGHEVRTAHEGQEAVAAAESFEPDVALLDLGMPTMSGYEVARRIRQHPRGGEIVLIALTGWGQQEYRRRSKEAGFDHHLTKPVDVEMLQRILAETAKGARERRLAAR